VTLRDNTERPETIEVGANTLAGASPDEMMKQAHHMLAQEGKWINPFGDGRAAERIVGIASEGRNG
jgi:UDP-N-acetylglucosamine 2-epimerase (non-hydrolysing)